MKIGLMRHFPVSIKHPGRLTPVYQEDVIRWLSEYDTAEVRDLATPDQTGRWKKCYTSSLPRAMNTAKRVFGGEIIPVDLLREPRPGRVFKHNNIRLPFFLWMFIMRTAILFNHKSQQEDAKSLRLRIKAFINEILSNEKDDVLIVGHGLTLCFLAGMLVKMGFRGPRIIKPDFGAIYVFEKKRGD